MAAPYWEYDGTIKDYQLTVYNLDAFVGELQKHLGQVPVLNVNVNNPSVGKWGMARLWRKWMFTTAEFMAGNGCTMPLMINANGLHYGQRPFDTNDAHELFTRNWLGVDADGVRLSWAKQARDGMRPANKGERFHAMQKHEKWAIEKGIQLLKPRSSEYVELEQEQG